MYNTYSMEQSPCWEANQFSASQDIPLILCMYVCIYIYRVAQKERMLFKEL